MSNSSERLYTKSYMRRPNAKTWKDPMKYAETGNSSQPQVKNTRHVKSKSSIPTKYKDEKSNINIFNFR